MNCTAQWLAVATVAQPVCTARWRPVKPIRYAHLLQRRGARGVESLLHDDLVARSVDCLELV